MLLHTPCLQNILCFFSHDPLPCVILTVSHLPNTHPVQHNSSPFWFTHTRIKHSSHSYHIQWSQHWYLPSHCWWRNTKQHLTTRRKVRKRYRVETNNTRHELSLNNGQRVIRKFHWMDQYNCAFQWWLITVSFQYYLVFIALWWELCEAAQHLNMLCMICLAVIETEQDITIVTQEQEVFTSSAFWQVWYVLTHGPQKAWKKLNGKLLVNRLMVIWFTSHRITQDCHDSNISAVHTNTSNVIKMFSEMSKPH